MVDIISNLIKHLKSFESQLNQTIEDAIRSNEDLILKMNTESQLYEKGVDNEGKKLKPKYTLSTTKAKKKKGQPTNRVILKDEGIFHDSFYIYYTQDGFEIMTSDPIEPYLTYKYGKELLGLTDKNLNIVIKTIILPALIFKFETL